MRCLLYTVRLPCDGPTHCFHVFELSAVFHGRVSAGSGSTRRFWPWVCLCEPLHMSGHCTQSPVDRSHFMSHTVSPQAPRIPRHHHHLINHQSPTPSPRHSPITTPSPPSIGTRLAFIAFFTAVARSFDAITDPLMAWVTDQTRTRWGRRRPYIVRGFAHS
jgi:MFS transporter